MESAASESGTGFGAVRPGRMKLVVGVSGGSGIPYAWRALQALQAAGVETHLIVSSGAKRVISAEAGVVGGAPMLTLADLNLRWNRNLLVMGDLNDEPIHRSVLDYLQGSKDLDHVEEEIKGSAGQPPDVKSYLGKQAFLFNAMWPQFAVPDRGTFYFSGATNSMNLLDQFMVSRGLYFGGQGLQFDPASVAIFNQPPVASPRGRPIAFDRKKLTGYSDHFPITSRIRVL